MGSRSIVLKKSARKKAIALRAGLVNPAAGVFLAVVRLWNVCSSRPGFKQATHSNADIGIVRARCRRAALLLMAGIRNEMRPFSWLKTVRILLRSLCLIVRSAIQCRVVYNRM